jgi:hypothetical protein
LCGPLVHCVVGAHEIVSTDSVLLGAGTTAITVDAAGRPIIMYGTEGADGGFHGHVAERNDGAPEVWATENTAFDLKTVALATSSDGVTHALVFDGAKTVSHVKRTGNQWSDPDLLASAGQGGGDRLQVDDAGCVRAAFPNAGAQEQLAT